MSLIERPSCCQRAALVVLLGLILAAPPLLCAGDDTKRDPIKGEVDDKTAFVQTMDYKASGSVCVVEAKIKFVKAGTYTVVGGYYKGEYFHESTLGKKYFATKSVKVDAGDVITVKLKASIPPANKKITAAVFKSEKDIRTKN